MNIFKYLIPIVVTTSLLAAQNDDNNRANTKKAIIGQSVKSKLLGLRFENLREKQFSATVIQRYRIAKNQKEAEVIYKLEQNCLSDGFRRLVTSWNTEARDQMPDVTSVTELLWVPSKGYISTTTHSTKAGPISKERLKCDQDSRSLIKIPTNSMSLIGLIWDGQRIWDLTDKKFWLQSSIEEPKGIDESSRLKVPSGVELEIKLSGSDKDVLEFTIHSTYPGQLAVVTTYRWNQEEFLGLQTVCRGQNGYQVFDELKVTAHSKDDGIREFSVAEVKLGDEVVVVSDQGVRYEYLGNGLAKPVIDSKSERKIKDLYSESSGEVPIASDLDKDFARSTYMDRRNNSAHCGIYALAGFYASQAEWVSLAELFGKSRNDGELLGPNGTTASAMISDIRARGFHARLVKKMGLEFLDQLDAPAIIHFGHSYQAEGTSHWVLYLGTDSDGGYRILDFPRNETSVDGPLLLSYWSGSAIVASKGSDRVSSVVLSHRISQLTKYFAYIAIPLCVLVVISSGHLKLERRRTIFQVFGPLLVATLLSAFWLSYSKASPTRSKIASAVVRHKSNVTSSKLLPRCTNALLQENDVAVIDCRLPSAFESGHIPGAINLPVDASIGELRDALLRLDAPTTVVCYCQSEQCQWADRVGKLLNDVGNYECSVLQGGWIGYTKWSVDKKR